MTLDPQDLKEIRQLTDVVIALEDARIVKLYAVPGGQCPYPSDVARALYERGVRVRANLSRDATVHSEPEGHP